MKVIKRKIKYPRLELKTGDLVMVLPYGEKMTAKELLLKHSSWVEKKKDFIESIKKKYSRRKLFARDKEELATLVIGFVEEAGKILNTKPNKVSFRLMKTKWASCSRKGNLNFNLLLRYLPKNIIWYVVYHEMCHLLIPKHNKSFWYLVGRKFENFSKYEEALHGYWFRLNGKNND